MKRFSAVILVLTSAVYFAGISSAATLTGTTCSPKGKTEVEGSFRYTCIQSGKKLVWGAGVKVASKSTTTTVVSTPSTTTTTTQPEVNPGNIFSPSILWQQAAIEAYNYKETRTTSKLTLDVVASPDFVTSSFSTRMQNAMQTALTYWQGLAPKSETLDLLEVNENDVTWATKELAALGSSAYDSYLFNAGAWNINGNSDSSHQDTEEFLPSTSGLPVFLLFVGSQSSPDGNVGLLSESYHNSTHGIMFLLDGLNYETNPPSCWFSEGDPSFYGYSLSMADEQVSMSQTRAAQFQVTLNDGFVVPSTPAGWLTFLEANDSRSDQGCYTYALGYSIGTAMIERLILDYGPQRVNNWMIAQAAAGGEWKNSFAATFGLSVDSWYAKSAIPYLQATFAAQNFEATGS
jgi:hypothetical protein